MNVQNSYFLLYSNCIVTKGKGRSLLCDLQNEHYLFIPNELVKVLNQAKKYKIYELYIQYPALKEVLSSFFEYLSSLHYGFYTKTPELFPQLSTQWKSPLPVTNAIVDIADPLGTFAPEAILQLDRLGCESLQLRFFCKTTWEAVASILKETLESRIKSIELLLPDAPGLSPEGLDGLLRKHLRVSAVTVYGAPASSEEVHPITSTRIMYSHKMPSNALHCGQIAAHFFAPNLYTYTESQRHNSCLNRKISIDAAGNIKNCPSMAQSFGNIQDTTLQEALNHPAFKKYWNVTKDQIDVCRDCEFRYICTDCRAYLENPEADMRSKPLKCGYDPNTCTWEEWSTHPMKQQAIDYYGMREVLPAFKIKPDYVPASQPRPERMDAQ